MSASPSPSKSPATKRLAGEKRAPSPQSSPGPNVDPPPRCTRQQRSDRPQRPRYTTSPFPFPSTSATTTPSRPVSRLNQAPLPRDLVATPSSVVERKWKHGPVEHSVQEIQSANPSPV